MFIAIDSLLPFYFLFKSLHEIKHLCKLIISATQGLLLILRQKQTEKIGHVQFISSFILITPQI